MRRASLTPAVVFTLAFALPAAAAGPTLDHQPVSCLVAGQYPRLTACISAPDEVARVRVFFRPEGTPAWYHVSMERDAACFAGVLPKPQRKLVGRTVEYYVEAADRRFETSRTGQHAARVVRRSWECRDPLVAAIAAGGPSAVFPALPPGFAAGGIGTGTLLAVVGAGAAGGGALLVTGGGKPEDPPPPPPPPGAPPTTAPLPTATSTTTTTTTLPLSGPLAVTCEARPDNGPVPLAVAFTARASGGGGTPTFRWDFGDGATAEGASVEHTYRASGRFEAVVLVTSGSESERCGRAIAAAVPPTRRVALTVAKAGNGDGTVSSSPGGIDCGGSCSAEFEAGSAVRLTATAASGSAFRGWSGGGCSGTGPCALTLDAPATVTATFERAASPPRTLTVEKAGAGSGRVTSSPAGINCGSDCTEAYAAGTAVTLTAVPDAGSSFAGWSGGGCSGAGVCSLRMDVDATVTASFDRVGTQQHPLTVLKAGSGNGRVTSSPAGIDCGTDCTEAYAAATAVDLAAVAAAGSTFAGWDGAGCSGTGGCRVIMNAAQTVTARFDLAPARMFALAVELAGRGTGTVMGTGIGCPVDCTESYAEGSGVTIEARPGAETVFSGWELDCFLQGSICQLTMNGPKRARARFDALFQLNVSVSGPGHVTGDSGRIQCPGTCTTTRVDGAVVTLNAFPAAGASFAGWGGDCAGGMDTCQVTMDRHRFASATFRASLQEDPRRPAEDPAASLTWTSQLEAAGASGVVRAAGHMAGAGPGTAVLVLPLRPGENLVEAELISAEGPGTWRFAAQAPGLLEPGTFRVLAGEVVQVEPEAIVFRLAGKAGERIAFGFRASAAAKRR